MGLDIYVGTLTRYITGDWTLSTQQWAEEMGLPFGILGSHQTQKPEKHDPRKVRQTVLDWRKKLARKMETRLEWDESDKAPWFTEKPGRSFCSLAVWAAHEEHPSFPRPSSQQEASWDDPAIQASRKEGFASRYAHLLRPSLWIPAEIDAPFMAEDAIGDPTWIGSCDALLEALRILNARTWEADLDHIENYASTLPDPGAGFEWDACCAFSTVFKLARSAVHHRLPMVLDV